VIECIESIKKTCIEKYAIYVLLNDANLDYKGHIFLKQKAQELNFSLIVSAENLGLQAARNILLAESKFDYTMGFTTDLKYKWAVFCDSDVVFKHKTWDGELDYIFDEDYEGKVMAGHSLFYPIEHGDHKEVTKENHDKVQCAQGYFTAYNPPPSDFSEDFSFWCEDNDNTLYAISSGYLVIQVPKHYMVHKGHMNQIHNAGLYDQEKIRRARVQLDRKWYSSGRFNYHQ
jgi:GT2 family glycosyltransferase